MTINDVMGIITVSSIVRYRSVKLVLLTASSRLRSGPIIQSLSSFNSRLKYGLEELLTAAIRLEWLDKFTPGTYHKHRHTSYY